MVVSYWLFCALILTLPFLVSSSSVSGLGEEPPDVCRTRGGGGVEGAHQGAVREELGVGARERCAQVAGQHGAARPAVQPAHPGQQHAAAAAAAAAHARHKQQQQQHPLGSPRGESECPSSAQHHLGVMPLPPIHTLKHTPPTDRSGRPC